MNNSSLLKWFLIAVLIVFGSLGLLFATASANSGSTEKTKEAVLIKNLTNNDLKGAWTSSWLGDRQLGFTFEDNGIVYLAYANSKGDLFYKAGKYAINNGNEVTITIPGAVTVKFLALGFDPKNNKNIRIRNPQTLIKGEWQDIDVNDRKKLILHRCL